MHSTQCSEEGSYAFQVLESRGFHGNSSNFKGCANLEFTMKADFQLLHNDFNAATEQSVFLFSTLAIWFKHDLNHFKL